MTLLRRRLTRCLIEIACVVIACFGQYSLGKTFNQLKGKKSAHQKSKKKQHTLQAHLRHLRMKTTAHEESLAKTALPLWASDQNMATKYQPIQTLIKPEADYTKLYVHPFSSDGVAGEVSETDSLAQSLIEDAKTLIGTPYRYGGSTPNGFDCSGFVRYVFGSYGIDLDRSSSSQALQGESVDVDAMRPGDLLFFHTQGRRGRISHVGIYIGNGQFIHSGSWGKRRERGVRIDYLASSYYSRRLVTVRRVLAEEHESEAIAQVQ